MNLYKKVKNGLAFLLANLQVKINKPENAIAIAKVFLDSSEPDENLLRLLVATYWNSYRFEDSLATLRRLESLYPNRKSYKWELGFYYFDLGYFEQALPLFEYCFKENPKTEDFHSGFALSYLNLERYDEAEEIIDHAMQVAPWNPVLCLAIPFLYLATARFESIEGYLNKYIDEYPTLTVGYGEFARHLQYRMRLPEQSLIWYSKAEALFSNTETSKYLSKYRLLDAYNERVLDGYVEALIQAGRKEEALVKIENYIKRDKKNLASRSRLMEYYLHTGDYITAEKKAHLIYESIPKFHHYFLAYAWFKQDRFTEAKALVVDSLKKFSHVTDLWSLLGDIERSLGNWQAAIDAYEAALKIYPVQPDTLCNLSMCYRQAGMDNDSLRAARKRTLFDPKNPEAWFDLSGLYQHMGQVLDAEETNKKGLDLSGGMSF